MANSDEKAAQAARLREHLDAAAALTRGRDRIRKAELHAVQGHVNAARAHLLSLEIALGYRGIGAVLADDEATRSTLTPNRGAFLGDPLDGRLELRPEARGFEAGERLGGPAPSVDGLLPASTSGDEQE